MHCVGHITTLRVLPHVSTPIRMITLCRETRYAYAGSCFPKLREKFGGMVCIVVYFSSLGVY